LPSRITLSRGLVLVALVVLLVLLLGGAFLLGAFDRESAPEAETAPPPAAEAGAESESAEAAPEPLPATRIVPTGLHRVAITEMELGFPNPAQAQQVGGRIFMLTRGGILTVYEPESASFVELARIEQNRRELRRSEIFDLQHFDMGLFRALGLFVEHADGVFTAYVSHHLFGDECFYFQVSTLSFTLDESGPDVLEDWAPLYTALPCVEVKEEGHPFAGHQSGGRLVPFDDHHLLVSTGDFELDGHTGPATPLDPASPYGKILLLDKQSGGAEVFASGLRNPQGLLRTGDGRIFATDHGPQGGDELNRIERGKAYGWPEETYGLLYGNRPWPLAEVQGRHDRYQQPVFVWMPSIGISNLTEVGRGQFDLWEGDLIVSALRGKSLYRVRMEGERVVYVEQIELERRIRDVTTLESGEILALADGPRLMVVSDAGPLYERAKGVARIRDELPLLLASDAPEAATAGAVVSGQDLFQSSCASCHRLDGGFDVSVPLDGVLGRQVGSLDGYAYSPALAADTRHWDAGLLRDFLLRRDPALAATSMPAVELSEAEAERVIDYIEGVAGE
jgi:aldose sugar dehydrogenase